MSTEPLPGKRKMSAQTDGDKAEKRYWWDRLRAMSKSERFGFVARAFEDENMPIIFAVLNYKESGELEPVAGPSTVAEWEKNCLQKRFPDLAPLAAALLDNRAKLAGTVKQVILEITNDSGLEGTLEDRMKAKNEAILGKDAKGA